MSKTDTTSHCHVLLSTETATNPSARLKTRNFEIAEHMTERVHLPCVVLLTRHSRLMLDQRDLPKSLEWVRAGIAARLGVAVDDPRVSWSYSQRDEFDGTVEVQMTTVREKAA